MRGNATVPSASAGDRGVIVFASELIVSMMVESHRLLRRPAAPLAVLFPAPLQSLQKDELKRGSSVRPFMPKQPGTWATPSAPRSAIDPQHLAALPSGIDRHPRCAEQFGKALSTQHIVAGDNFGDTSATTLTRPGERCLKFSVGRSRVLDGKPIIRSEWLFLDRRDRRCASGRIDLDPERHAVADLAAACDRFLVALEQYLLEIGLCRQFCGKAQGLEARMPIVS